MSKYALLFSKTGYIRYTSHLDLLRLFKRAFRRAGIAVSYSQGFNPHPRMGFCQPLSLGYTGLNEMIEFQTDTDTGRAGWMDSIGSCLPEGIKIIKIGLIADGQRSLAASVNAASYEIRFPVPFALRDFVSVVQDFMSQDEILCEKKTKKGTIDTVDIKGKIRSLEACQDNGRLMLRTSLDSGSQSNLSPELLIKAFLAYSLPYTERYDIEVTRTGIDIDVDYDITWM